MKAGRIAGILLAGGRSSRMGGGGKSLRMLTGRQMLGHAADRLRPQVAASALGATGDPKRFATFGLPVLADTIPGFAGALAGILAGMDWAARPPLQCDFALADFPMLALKEEMADPSYKVSTKGDLVQAERIQAELPP